MIIQKILKISIESGLVVVGQGVSVLGALFILRILTNNISVEEFGVFALYLTASTFINQIFFGAINSSVGRYYAISIEVGKQFNYIDTIKLLLRKITIGIVLLLIFVFLALLYLKYNNILEAAAYTLIFALLTGYSSTIISVFNAVRKRKYVAFVAISDLMVKTICLNAYFYSVNFQMESMLQVYCVSALISLLINIACLKFLEKSVFKKIQNVTRNNGSEMWSYAWPFFIMGSIAWLQASSSRWVLEAYSGAVDVGQFHILSQISAPIQVITAVIITYLSPIFFLRMGDGSDVVKNKDIRKITLTLSVAGIFVIGSIAWFASKYSNEVAGIIFAKTFEVDMYYLPWFIASAGILGISQLFCAALYGEMREREIIISGVISGILGLLLNAVFGINFGLAGVVYAQLIFAVVNFLLLQRLFLK